MKALRRNIEINFCRALYINQRVAATWGTFIQENLLNLSKNRRICGIVTWLTLIHSSPPPDSLENWQSYNSSCEDHSLVGITVTRLGLGHFAKFRIQGTTIIWRILCCSGQCYYLISLLSTALSQDVSQNNQWPFFKYHSCPRQLYQLRQRKMLDKENLMNKMPMRGFEKLWRIAGDVYSSACTL